jgi:UDP-3-O-[3-hydroxymyristoyl] glucosamine N-acyltransferase
MDNNEFSISQENQQKNHKKSQIPSVRAHRTAQFYLRTRAHSSLATSKFFEHQTKQKKAKKFLLFTLGPSSSRAAILRMFDSCFGNPKKRVLIKIKKILGAVRQVFPGTFACAVFDHDGTAM